MSLATDPRILPDPKPRFLVVSYADSAIIVRLRVHANYDDFFDLGYYLHRQLKGAMGAHNVSIPYPQRVIRYASDDEADGSVNEA